MIKRILRHLARQLLPALAVLLFAAVLTAVLCRLHKNSQEELKSYEEAYAAVPVFFKVTDLDGSKVKERDGIAGWIVELFSERGIKPNLQPYVGEMHIRASITATHYLTNEYGWPVLNKYNRQMTEEAVLTGISSTRVGQELTEGWGGKIYWNEGYDESILLSDELVCLVPESMNYKTKLELEFDYQIVIDGVVWKDTWLKRTFQVVGYYTDPGNTRIYCPYNTVAWVHAYLSKPKSIEQIGAILNDNTQLDALKETAAKWFAQPNPSGTKTPWGRFGYEYYFYALDIEDGMLTDLSTSMKNSLRLNELVSAVVFALSAGAGFLTGFLVIRSRKREIALMRTMGNRQASIFLELAAEQVLCLTVGIVLGGSYALWQPPERLGLFGGIYCVGLIAALIIFLRKNLLTTIKEEE